MSLILTKLSFSSHSLDHEGFNDQLWWSAFLVELELENSNGCTLSSVELIVRSID